MVTLYTQAEKNIRKTFILMTTFLIFIIFLGWLFSQILQNDLILYFAIFFALFQSFLSYWYSDKIVLALTRAKKIEKRDNPQLYRIVENLCLASGLPLPKIYILEEEQPNAFATGRNKNHATIVVTKGLLEKLEKVELEGVIAHELAHIKNKDMLLQTVLVVLVGFVAILSNWFLRISFWGFRGKERKKRRGNFLWLFGFIAAILAPICAKLIQLAISRKREFLADATGALITRYPEGLASALEKIARDNSKMRIASPATAHLFFSNPFKGEQ
jgi:heat shock protein HtpX